MTNYSVVYFYRHPNPRFFSLEKVFGGISGRIAQDCGDEFSIDSRRLPFSGVKSLVLNMLYVARHQADVNHITGDIHYSIMACRRRSINVLTIHDCVMLARLTPGGLRYRIMKWLWYDLPVKKADVVTVISENTKKELLGYTKCDPQKIRVITNYVDPAFVPSPADFNADRPRILFVGVTPNKNLDRLAEALKGLPAELDIIGTVTPDQAKILDDNSISWTQSAGLSAEQVRRKYVDADMLAFPSTYEGFGLPIVEAQATGRPVLTSALSPMQDVAGKGACLVDPYSVDSIREGIRKIIADRDYRNCLVGEGYKNVKRFRLEEIAGQYATLYRQLLQNKSK